MESEFNQKDIQILSKSLANRIESYKKGEILSAVEKDENKVCAVLEGLIYLCVENEDGNRIILRFFRKGEFFDDNMLPKNGMSYFLVKQSAKAAVFNRSDLFALTSGGMAWREKLSALIKSQFEAEFSKTAMMLHQKTIRSRFVMFLKNEFNIQGTNPIILPIPLTDTAEYICAERSAFMREVSKMKKDGLISGQNRTIMLNNALLDE